MTDEDILGLAMDAQALETTRSIKLQLPVRTHVRLRSEKLLRRETIAATVNAAVTAYLARHGIPEQVAASAREQG